MENFFDKSSQDHIIVTTDELNLRVDSLLTARFGEYSRTYFQQLITSGKVFLNGQPLVKKGAKVKENDEIEIFFVARSEKPSFIEPENIFLDILFEDNDLLVVNKPSGLVVHPASGNWTHTFVNALLYHCKTLPENADNSLRPGIVHRLDKDTTGILVAAKNEKAQQNLMEQFANRSVEKEYLALCVGNAKDQTISSSIGRHPHFRKEMTALENVLKNGKEAVTQIALRSRAIQKNISLILAKPFTGRTHQIRVHLAKIGCPILGDPLYGNLQINKKFDVFTQQLHAWKLSFFHPKTAEKLCFTAPLPSKFSFFLEQFQLML